MNEISRDYGKLDWRLAPGNVAEIVDIEVDNLHRREGEGLKLFQKLVRDLPEQCNHVYAFTRKSNAIARDWYRSLGFRESVVPGFYSDNDPDAVLEHKRIFSVLYVANFDAATNKNQDEIRIADCLDRIGVSVTRWQEDGVCRDQIVDEMRHHDCLLFAKGRLEGDSSGIEISTTCQEVRAKLKKPCFMWVFDRYANYTYDRAEWISRVASEVNVAFVTDGELPILYPSWRYPKFCWHVLRQGFHSGDVEQVPESEPVEWMFPVVHLGGVYGERCGWAKELELEFADGFDVIEGVHGKALNHVARNTCVLVCPDWPVGVGYWSNRLQMAAGYGFLIIAPHLPGMREEGFEELTTFVPYERKDMLATIKQWLKPEMRGLRISIRTAAQRMAMDRLRWEYKVPVLARRMSEVIDGGR